MPPTALPLMIASSRSLSVPTRACSAFNAASVPGYAVSTAFVTIRARGPPVWVRKVAIQSSMPVSGGSARRAVLKLVANFLSVTEPPSSATTARSSADVSASARCAANADSRVSPGATPSASWRSPTAASTLPSFASSRRRRRRRSASSASMAVRNPPSVAQVERIFNASARTGSAAQSAIRISRA